MPRLAGLLAAALLLAASLQPQQHGAEALNFRLRHVLHHGQAERFFKRFDVPAEHPLAERVVARDVVAKSGRPHAPALSPHFTAEMAAKHSARAVHGDDASIPLPDPQDQTTLLGLVTMTSNAYLPKEGSSGWLDLPGYSINTSFGWTQDGLRGHVFIDDDNTALVVALKGTDLTFLGVGGATSAMDKLMDNSMFSCCCARVDLTWTPVCSCYKDSTSSQSAVDDAFQAAAEEDLQRRSGPRMWLNDMRGEATQLFGQTVFDREPSAADQVGQLAQKTCYNSCLSQALKNDRSYYSIAMIIYLHLRDLYPTTPIWFTGHSLGGALASLLSITTGYPAITFESPGEALYAERIGLINDGNRNDFRHIFHFADSTDPIFFGRCTGVSSVCYIGGYALETSCHIGHECIYDEKSKEPLDVLHHRLVHIIPKVVSRFDPPECRPAKACDECSGWSFV